MDCSILNSIDQHGLSNKSFKLSIKNYDRGTTKKFCKHLQQKVWRKPDAVVTHVRTIDITSNIKSWENFKYIMDPVRSKLPNCKNRWCQTLSLEKAKMKLKKSRQTQFRVDRVENPCHFLLAATFFQ